MLDLLIPGRTPGIKEQIIDLYNKPELLFFGPDGKCITISTYDRIFILIYHRRGHGRYDGLGSLCVLVECFICFPF